MDVHGVFFASSEGEIKIDHFTTTNSCTTQGAVLQGTIISCAGVRLCAPTRI
jgi:hypothetical protein